MYVCVCMRARARVCINECVWCMCLCVCMCVCVCTCMRVCICVCVFCTCMPVCMCLYVYVYVYVYVYTCVCVHACVCVCVCVCICVSACGCPHVCLRVGVVHSTYEPYCESFFNLTVFILAPKKQSAKSTGGSGRISWTDNMVEDLFDIIMSSELLRRSLLLENMGHATKSYYESVAKGLRNRIELYCEDHAIFPNADQCRNKVKNIKSECKAISLMKKTESGIERERVERGYGLWWQGLYKLVASTASANPDLIVEPSAAYSGDEVSTSDTPDSGDEVSTSDTPDC